MRDSILFYLDYLPRKIVSSVMIGHSGETSSLNNYHSDHNDSNRDLLMNRHQHSTVPSTSLSFSQDELTKPSTADKDHNKENMESLNNWNTTTDSMVLSLCPSEPIHTTITTTVDNELLETRQRSRSGAFDGDYEYCDELSDSFGIPFKDFVQETFLHDENHSNSEWGLHTTVESSYATENTASTEATDDQSSSQVILDKDGKPIK